MDSIFDNYKKTGYLHHAHVIEGSSEVVVPALVLAIKKHLGMEPKGNPDLSIKFFESFNIDEARDLKRAQSRASFTTKERKIFIIAAKSFPPESQNALLKTFEEPTQGTHFFIVLPRAEMLLPTLRSRVLVFLGNTENVDVARELAEKFLHANLSERFAITKKLAEKKAEESIDREVFRRMFDQIERILYSRLAGKRDEATTLVFGEIFKAKTYLADRGSSPKMLLEHLAMILPNAL